MQSDQHITSGATLCVSLDHSPIYPIMVLFFYFFIIVKKDYPTDQLIENGWSLWISF